MLAYCSALRLDHGTLIYARDTQQDTRRHSLPGGIELRVRAIDVESAPQLVLAQVAEIARDVHAGAARSSHHPNDVN